MTPDEREGFRRKIGAAMMAVQEDARQAGFPPTVVIPEMIAALLSLACYVAAYNAGMSREAMEQAMHMAKAEVLAWK